MNYFYKIGFFVLLVGLIVNSYYTYTVVHKLNYGFKIVNGNYETLISAYEVRVSKAYEGNSHLNYNNLGLFVLDNGKPKTSFSVDEFNLCFQTKDSSHLASFRVNPLGISQYIHCADSMVGVEYNCFNKNN